MIAQAAYPKPKSIITSLDAKINASTEIRNTNEKPLAYCLNPDVKCEAPTPVSRAAITKNAIV